MSAVRFRGKGARREALIVCGGTRSPWLRWVRCPELKRAKPTVADHYSAIFRMLARGL